METSKEIGRSITTSSEYDNTEEKVNLDDSRKHQQVCQTRPISNFVNTRMVFVDYRTIDSQRRYPRAFVKYNKTPQIHPQAPDRKHVLVV